MRRKKKTTTKSNGKTKWNSDVSSVITREAQWIGQETITKGSMSIYK